MNYLRFLVVISVVTASVFTPQQSFADVEPSCGNAQQVSGSPVAAKSGDQWLLKLSDESISQVDISFLDIDENVVKFSSVPVSRAQVKFGTPDLKPGFYRMVIACRRASGKPAIIERTFSTLPAVESSALDIRFGVDAALSRYGGDDASVKRALDTLLAAGVGTVRDRLNWSHVQPEGGRTNWGRFLSVAKLVHSAGIRQVTVFHDAPKWVRPGDPATNGDRRPPTNLQAVYSFGTVFARDMGRYFDGVEYWNEQNGDFFFGTPWEYANGLKAFSAGVKSVRPDLKVLIGAAAGDPGPFFDGIYENDVAPYVDVLNQHYYADPTRFLDFVRSAVASREKSAGLSGRPAWLTETGIGVQADSSVSRRTSERAQAVHLVKAFATGFSAGYERVFYFFLRELEEEGRNNWGILNADFSPRPAYVALATLIRHVGGRPFSGYMVDGGAFTAYFGDATHGYVAVGWADDTRPVWPAGSSLVDIFGRVLTEGRVPRGEPVLVSGLRGTPGSIHQWSAEGAVALKPPPALLDADVVDPDAARGRNVAENALDAVVPEGGRAVVLGHVTAVGPSAVRGVSIACNGTNGLSAVRPTIDVLLRGSEPVAFQCEYDVGLRRGARGTLSVVATGDGWRNAASMKVVSVPELRGKQAAASRSAAMTAGSQAPSDPLLCLDWRARSAASVRSTVQPKPDGQGCVASFAVSSTITSPGDGWVFPIADLTPKYANAVGVSFASSAVDGARYPVRPLLMQLVDASGVIWVVPLITRRGDAGRLEHEAMFSRATVAAWSKVKPAGAIGAAPIRSVSIGYAGGGTQPGDRIAFEVTDLRALFQR